MASKQTTFRDLRSIAGAVLVTLGMFILYANLAGAADRLRHLFSANGSYGLGVMSAVIGVVAQVLHAHATDHHRFLHGVIQHALVLSWPLLLGMVGTVWSRDALTDRLGAAPKKDCDLVDLSARRSTLN